MYVCTCACVCVSVVWECDRPAVEMVLCVQIRKLEEM